MLYADRKSDYEKTSAESDFDAARTLGVVNAILWIGVASGAGLTTYVYVTRPEQPRTAGAGARPGRRGPERFGALLSFRAHDALHPSPTPSTSRAPTHGHDDGLPARLAARRVRASTGRNGWNQQRWTGRQQHRRQHLGAARRKAEQSGAATGGSSGSAGSGGDAGECSTNAECASDVTGPGRCHDGTCVPLRSNDCFLVEGNPNDDDAVFLGAFASFYAESPSEGLTVYPLTLAVEELNQPTDDRAPGLNGAEIALVVCDNSNAAAIDRAMTHLVDEVGVPAVLATLKPADLGRAFAAHPDVLFLSPVGRTKNVDLLNAELDVPLVWNLLGRPSDYTNVYVRLLGLVEDYVRAKNQYADTDPVRVALVVDDAEVDAANAELGEILEASLRFNGESPAVNGDNFRLVPMTRDTTIAEAVEELWNFVPDIVISASGSEFTKSEGVLWSLENEWVSSPRPFYVLSPYNAGDSQRRSHAHPTVARRAR